MTLPVAFPVRLDAPLGRIEGQTAFRKMLQRFPNLQLGPGPITWRNNLGLRGLNALPVVL